jgi:uncharacterized membrane protein HdeD (DUF308 family)
MSTSFPLFLSSIPDELYGLRRNWGWFLALGVALIAVGVLAIGFPVAATLTTVEVFGFLLIVAGVVEVASGFWTRRWGGFLQHLLCGLLYLFIGLVLIERPALGAAGYTLLLTAFFVASGLFRVVYALWHRFSGWGWVLVGGAVALLLGVMIWQDFPESALWVIGTFLGIDLIFNGWSWVMVGLAARSLPAEGAGPLPGPLAAGAHGAGFRGA